MKNKHAQFQVGGQGLFNAGFWAAVETILIAACLGTLLFFPFVSQYGLERKVIQGMAAFAAGGVVTVVLCAGLFLPALAMLRKLEIKITGKELACLLMVLAIFGELVFFLVFKGVHPPAYRGKLFLFGLMMISAFSSWVFAMRYEAISRLLSPTKQ